MAWRVEFEQDQKKKRKEAKLAADAAEKQERLDEIDRKRFEREEYRKQTRERQRMAAEEKRCRKAWDYQRKVEEAEAERVRKLKVRKEKERLRRIRHDEKMAWRRAKGPFRAAMAERERRETEEIKEAYLKAATDMKEHYERVRALRAKRLKAKREKKLALHKRPKYMQIEMEKKERAREQRELEVRRKREEREERERKLNARQQAAKWSVAPSTYDQFYQVTWDWTNGDGLGNCVPVPTPTKLSEHGKARHVDAAGMVSIAEDGFRHTPYANQPKGLVPTAPSIAKEYREVIVPRRAMEAEMERQRQELLEKMKKRQHKKKKKGGAGRRSGRSKSPVRRKR